MPLNEKKYSGAEESRQELSSEIRKLGRPATTAEIVDIARRLRAKGEDAPKPSPASAAPSLYDRLKTAIAERQAEARQNRNSFADITAGAANDDVYLSPAELEDLRALDELTADEPAAPVVDLVKSSPRRKRRRSGLRDLQDRYRLRDFERLAPAATTAPASAASVENPPSPSSPLSPSFIAAWRDTTEVTKVTFYSRALDSFGAPFAFTLNLSPDVIEAANDNKRGFLDLVRRRVARELKKELGREVPAWLMIETTEDGRPHLHGGLALSPELTAAEIEAATRAMNRAGGLWRGKGKEYQTDIRETYDPDGWARYSLKRIGRTKRHLREAAGLAPKAKVAILSVTRELRNEAERRHKEIRAAIRAALLRRGTSSKLKPDRACPALAQSALGRATYRTPASQGFRTGSRSVRALARS
jgi:hypothetical protein